MRAAEVPLRSAADAFAVLQLAVRMAQIGNINAISDAGAGANLALAALRAACLNVRINLLGYEQDPQAQSLRARAGVFSDEADALMQELNATLAERGGI